MEWRISISENVGFTKNKWIIINAIGLWKPSILYGYHQKFYGWYDHRTGCHINIYK